MNGHSNLASGPQDGIEEKVDIPPHFPIPRSVSRSKSPSCSWRFMRLETSIVHQYKVYILGKSKVDVPEEDCMTANFLI